MKTCFTQFNSAVFYVAVPIPAPQLRAKRPGIITAVRGVIVRTLTNRAVDGQS